MIALNDNSIFIGQIKQLLHTFNLPTCQIGDQFPKANSHYIKNNSIYYWDNMLRPVYCAPYVYGRAYLNITSNFEIDNLLYDKKTHEYLGKYLRFLRDYKNINLMSMYNCFTADINDFKFNFSVTREGAPVDIVFDTVTTDFIVYKIPISATNLTISTHNCIPVELCLSCINNNKTQVAEKNKIKAVAEKTYKKIKANDLYYLNFFDDIDRLRNSNHIDDANIIKNFIDSNSSQLCLLMRVPKNLNTSIVVLEGTYKAKNVKYNKKKIAFNGYENVCANLNFDIISQLLSHENNNQNFLLGDRIIEYLLGNAITNISDSYDIMRMQKTLYKMYLDKIIPYAFPTPGKYGIWNSSDYANLKYIIYNQDLYLKYDTIGFVDKDVETYLTLFGFDNNHLGE